MNGSSEAPDTPPSVMPDISNMPRRRIIASAGCRAVRQYPRDLVDSAVVARAAAVCRFKLDERTENFVRLKVGFNWRSWGESIDVAMHGIGDQMIVDVRSQCTWPMTVVDWGKNERNVTLLFQELDALLPPSMGGSKIALCPSCGAALVDARDDACRGCSFAVQEDWPTEVRSGWPWRPVLAATMLFTVGLGAVAFLVDILVNGGQLIIRGPLILRVPLWAVMTIAVGVLLLLMLTGIFQRRKRKEARVQNARS